MIDSVALALINRIHRILNERWGKISVTITDNDESPWILISVVRVEPHDIEEPHEWHLAMWRTTCEVYGMDSRGAVEDDPMREIEGQRIRSMSSRQC